LGGDSLSAARLVALLGEPVTFADLYSHPTVQELAQFMAGQTAPRSEHLLVLQPSTARQHLIVFPYAGGSAASYLSISQKLGHLTHGLNVIAVNLPAQRLPQSKWTEIPILKR